MEWRLLDTSSSLCVLTLNATWFESTVDVVSAFYSGVGGILPCVTLPNNHSHSNHRPFLVCITLNEQLWWLTNEREWLIQLTVHMLWSAPFKSCWDKAKIKVFLLFWLCRHLTSRSSIANGGGFHFMQSQLGGCGFIFVSRVYEYMQNTWEPAQASHWQMWKRSIQLTLLFKDTLNLWSISSTWKHDSLFRWFLFLRKPLLHSMIRKKWPKHKVVKRRLLDGMFEKMLSQSLQWHKTGLALCSDNMWEMLITWMSLCSI